ncbi:MAG: class I SAM-dependent methyltransferase [Anaerolineae bacterium]
MYTYEQLRAIAAGVQARHGWDFGVVRDDRAPVPWDYEAYTAALLRPGQRVLDIGMGGAEKLLRLAASPRFGWGLGIDAAPEMVADARENRAGSAAADRVCLAQMPAEALALADGVFDLVLCRHANLDVDETLRVLAAGGQLVTQQVGARNLLNICQAFGCGPGGEYIWDELDVYALADRFRARGCRVLVAAEYDVPYRLLDVASLLFLLQGVGIPEDYDLERHWPVVAAIIAEHSDARGIISNEHRELLHIVKP